MMGRWWCYTRLLEQPPLPMAGEEKETPPAKKAEPTEGDRENERRRQAIAERMEAEYVEALKLSLGTLGPGWTPWMKISLIDSDYYQRHDGTPEVRATAYKVYRGEERLTENSVYLMRRSDGTVVKADNYEDLFGDLLKEKHPTRGFTHNGTWIAYDRWTLCWSALEFYHPKSVETLAKLRATREANKDAKFAADYPLFDLAGFERQDKKP